MIVFIGSPRFRGDIAETRVRRILAAGLEKNRYTVLNDVTVPSSGGTRHIDHLVVSRFGIFVIESQYARGWVSGGEFQQRWKHYPLRRIALFDNPMHRNALQVQALGNLLKVPASKFHPVVVLVGQKGFKTEMPGNLVEPERLLAYIRKKAQPLLDADQANRLLKSIEHERIRPVSRIHVSKWTLLRGALFITLVAGIYLVFRLDIVDLQKKWSQQTEKETSPGLFRPDGSRKSEQELWEDSLLCAFSVDSGRCSCFEPGGQKVELETEKCRALAERGSVLKQ